MRMAPLICSQTEAMHTARLVVSGNRLVEQSDVGQETVGDIVLQGNDLNPDVILVPDNKICLFKRLKQCKTLVRNLANFPRERSVWFDRKVSKFIKPLRSDITMCRGILAYASPKTLGEGAMNGPFNFSHQLFGALINSEPFGSQRCLANARRFPR